MNISELLRWQYAGYEKFHRSRANLLIHIFAVPLFIVSSAALIVSLLSLAWFFASGAIVLMVISIGLQGRGHGREAQPPEPFTGALNAIARIFLEQWITFPRFVISGGWWRALQRSQSVATSETQIHS